MKKIPVYKFYKHKYGDELLVDVISYEKMMPDIRRTPVFSETFYSITLVLDGDTSVAINGRLRKLERGLIICSIPGEVWSFEDNPQLDALNLVFEKEFGPAPSSAWQIPLLRKAYERANLVIPVSEELVGNIACYFGNAYRWQAVSNTVDVDFFHFRERQSHEGRPFCFCCLANFWPLKGYDILLPAFRQLRASGLDVELHIAGRGTDSADCQKLFSEGVVSHGLISRDAVRDLLYQSDALVLASRSEVQPLALLEAMSTGIPTIATECVPKSLRIDGGCTIVPIDDVQALSDAMQRVMEKKDFNGKVVSEAVRRLASAEVIGKRLTGVFDTVLHTDAPL